MRMCSYTSQNGVKGVTVHTKKGVLGWGGEKRERGAVQEMKCGGEKAPKVRNT